LKGDYGILLIIDHLVRGRVWNGFIEIPFFEEKEWGFVMGVSKGRPARFFPASYGFLS